MSYIIFLILTLVILSLFVSKEKTEHFQTTESNEEITTQALSDLLNQININNNLVDSNKEISFDNLNINSISNELLTQFTEQLNLDISNVDTNAMEAINNGGEYTQNYEKTEKDIIKLKLIKEELNRRRLQKKNQFHLQTVKKNLEKLEKYDENDKLAIYSSCPNEPFAYNQLSKDGNKYNLELSRHPIKWYGLDGPELQNKLPYNFAVF